jgi:anti-sigma28 factor (negative regulator of flagellin synthesis)
MEIGPVSNKQPVQQGGAARPEQPAETPRPKATADCVEISDDARAKLAEAADRQLTADQVARRDKLELVKERIKSGYYDRPEVDQAVADRLIDDLDI